MNNIQIEYFLVVAQNLSFTKAAAELYISQPAISRQITALEKELGYALFDRTKRHTQLTKQGELYFDFFSRCKKEYSETAMKAKQYDHKMRGHLTIGCPAHWDTASFMYDTLQKLESKYPNVDICLECKRFFELDKSVRSGALDIIITPDCMLNSLNDDELHVKKLTAIPFFLLYSINHPQAQLETLRVIDFRDNVFYLPAEYKHAEELQRSIIAQYGFEPKFQLLDYESASTRVLNGLGVCLTDVWMRDMLFPGFRSMTLDASSTICVAWGKTNTNRNLELFTNELFLHFPEHEA